MRIGITTSVIQRGKTGIAEYLLSLLRALQAHAGMHQFVLFVLEEDLPLFEFARGRMQIVVISEKYRPPLRDIFWHQFVLPQLAADLELDVLHVPSYRRLVWRHTCALVGTVHDLAAFHVAGKYDGLRMFYGRTVAARLARRQHEIITVSQNTAHDITHFWNIPGERITVIHHGVDRNRFHIGDKATAGAECAERFGLKQPFFLYVARLEHPAKNHVPLIRAFEKFKSTTGLPWRIAFAGGDWHGADVIHQTIKASPACDDIRSLGFVSDADLRKLYRAAEVFLYPSLHEGFGLPPIEAMACGCPVLCSTRGALGEVVADAALTVDPTNVEEMAAQMARLAQDKSLREEFRARGIARAAQFDWGLAARKTLQVYERAIQKSGHSETIVSVPGTVQMRAGIGQ